MNEKLASLWGSPNRKPTLIGLVAFSAGTGFGFVLGRYSKKEKYSTAQLAEVKAIRQEIEDELEGKESNLEILDEPEEQEKHIIPKTVFEKVDGRIRPKRDPILAPPIVKKGEEFVIDVVGKPPDDPMLVTRSVFDDDEWNYELEEKIREQKPEGPYVIHKDEFYSNELDLTQVTLTYYAGDDIMVDEDERPIYSHEEVTGPLLFGHGSGDPNVVHIRNLKRKCEYEICRDPGLYSVEVLGLQIENNTRVRDLKHARAPGKFRDD